MKLTMPNGAGKSTLVKHFLHGRLPLVNPDNIAQAQPDIGPILAGKRAIQQRNHYLATGKSFFWETTLSGTREIVFMKKAKADGYKVNLVFLSAKSPNISVARVTERVISGGHAVPSEDVIRRFTRSLNNLPAALAIADRAYIFDNTDSRRRLLFSMEDGNVKHKAKSLPTWVSGVLLI